MALGIVPKHSSDYSIFSVGQSQKLISLRISNHNANAINYNKYPGAQYNVSIVIKSRRRTKNTFVADQQVFLDEYVYFEKDLAVFESPFSKIAMAIANFLENGLYVDTMGVAKRNVSP